MDPQGLMAMGQLGPQYGPMVTGLPPVGSFGTEGLPFMSNPLVAMMAAPHMQSMMGKVGMLPMGLGHDINVWDQLRRRQFFQMQQQAMTSAAQAERVNYYRTISGAMSLVGPMGPEQQRAAAQMADSVARFAPMMAMIRPELLDQLSGIRGSPVVMAQQMMNAGRYRVDPVTGRMGMDPESAGLMAKRVYNQLYERAPPEQMLGFGAGQMGQLYSELQYRGMMAGPMDRGQALARIAGAEPNIYNAAAARRQVAGDPRSMSSVDLDKMTADPAISDRLRAFDAERVKRSLNTYVKAVGAMRDIFGDMGRPNAPIPELLAGLEAMTMGSMGQIDPGRLHGMVRETYNLAKQGGMNMSTVMMMQQHAGMRAQQLGLEPIFAVRATQGSLAWGNAFRGLGLGMMGSWGAATADQMQQMDVNMRLSASNSPLANALGAFMRIREAVSEQDPVTGQRHGFQEGSTAESLARAIASEQTEFFDPTTKRMRSIRMGEDELFGILRDARGRRGEDLGLGEGTAREYMMQTEENRRMIEKNNLGNTLRRLQPQEFRETVMANTLRFTLGSELAKQGLGADAAKLLHGKASEIVGDLMKLNAEDLNPERRNAMLAQIMGQHLGGDISPEMSKRLGIAAGQFMGDFSRNLAEGDFGAKTPTQAFGLFSDRALEQAEKNRMQAYFEGQMQDAMAPLHTGSMLRRAVTALQTTTPGDPKAIERIMAQTFGGVNISDMQDTFRGSMTSIAKQMADIQKSRSELMSAVTPEQRAAAQKNYDDAMSGLGNQINDLAKLGTQSGIFTGSVRGAVSEKAYKAITEEERAGVTGSKTLTAEEAQGVLYARNIEKYGTITNDEVAEYAKRFWGNTSQPALKEAREALKREREGKIENISPEDIEKLQAEGGKDLSKADQEAIVKVRRAKAYEKRRHEIEHMRTEGGFFGKMLGDSMIAKEMADAAEPDKPEAKEKAPAASESWVDKAVRVTRGILGGATGGDRGTGGAAQRIEIVGSLTLEPNGERWSVNARSGGMNHGA